MEGFLLSGLRLRGPSLPTIPFSCPVVRVRPLTVLDVSMGGLSLMSVTVMMAVAVLERPKLRLPSMSVACTMMVYWETFYRRSKHTAVGYLSVLSITHSFICRNSRKTDSREDSESPPDSCFMAASMSSFKTSPDHVYHRLKAGASSLPQGSSSKILPIQ